MSKKFIKGYITEFKKVLDNLPLKNIEKAIEMIKETYSENRQIFIMGNGGSASTASHMACDFSKGTIKNVYDYKEKRFKVISLTDNIATITAYSNDICYEHIFLQQLRNLLQPKDIVIAISASGNSPNIILAAEYAKNLEAKVIGLTGFDGGKLLKIADCALHIPVNNYGMAEDCHLILNHLLTSYFINFKK